ncbi:MAG TPA: 50S ribosomal protein L21 [Anaerolineales bacterium]|nr:50S ribosomal protein L21 [Anaerolineales bacterium]
MRFAIVESGGKQYRAIEGRTIEVDRLPADAGNKFEFERVLLMADDDDILVGTPTVSDILVKVTVVDHTKGPKIDRFKYRPKKRIRVRGGHRQQYTRLMIDFIGRPDEEEKRKSEKAEAAPVVVEETPEVEEAPKEKPARSKSEGKQAKASTKKTSAKPAATKSTSKKTGKK